MYPQLNKTLSPEVTNTQVSSFGKGFFGLGGQYRIPYVHVETCSILDV